MDKTEEVYGFTGKFLRLDLTNRTANIEENTPYLRNNFVGGRGIGSYFLYKEVDPSVDAFDSRNKVIVAPGPLTGTGIPAGTKTTVVTKSPLTGGLTYPLASGSFGAWMKFCGYDFIVVEGKSDQPVWVLIQDGKITYHEADYLWGLTTTATRAKIAERVGTRASTLCIGPAGENLVRYACVIMDKREAGRGGAGAVLGSKMLKAIVCDTKQRKVNLFHRGALKTLLKKYGRLFEVDETTQLYRAIGTTRSMAPANQSAMLPTKNWQETRFEGYERLTGERLAQQFMTGTSSCYQCPVKCEHTFEVKEGEYAGAVSEGLEYETVFSLGPGCGNANAESVIMAGRLVDDLGLDSMSTGSTISFAMECFQRGLLTLEDTGGLDLTWGNHGAIIELIKKIAGREGIGDLLAEGSRRAALIIGKGAEDLSMTVKGQEMSGWDPRAAWGMALAYGTANRGGCHTSAAVFSVENQKMAGKYGKLIPRAGAVYEPYSIEGKAELVRFIQDNRAAMSALGACYFARPFYLDDYADMMTAVMGRTYSEKDLLEIGERIYNLEKAFNLRAGFVKKDDWLPKRFYSEPIKYGPPEGQKVPEEGYAKMLDEYYEIRGWDSHGIPTAKKARKLSLEFIIADLERLSGPEL